MTDEQHPGSPAPTDQGAGLLGASHLREIAARLGTAAQPVGRAVGANPVSIVVPCHRVVGGDGSLTGYAGGIARKRALLDLEEPSAEDREALF